MLIQEMSRDSSISLLKSSNIGRIACAQGAQPYVTPFSFAYHSDFVYSFATLGRKIEWMRANPLVCIEVDSILSRAEWQSVIVFGRYQELPATPEFIDAQRLAHDLLARIADWWDPGYARTISGGQERALVPIYFRIATAELSGHRATPDSDGVGLPAGARAG